MNDLTEALYQMVADKWEHIGIYLHLPMPTLKTIAAEHHAARLSQVPHWDTGSVAEESGPSSHLDCHYWGCRVSGEGAASKTTQRKILPTNL